jgi:hypothetical protein
VSAHTRDGLEVGRILQTGSSNIYSAAITQQGPC